MTILSLNKKLKARQKVDEIADIIKQDPGYQNLPECAKFVDPAFEKAISDVLEEVSKITDEE